MDGHTICGDLGVCMCVFVVSLCVCVSITYLFVFMCMSVLYSVYIRNIWGEGNRCWIVQQSPKQQSKDKQTNLE